MTQLLSRTGSGFEGVNGSGLGASALARRLRPELSPLAELAYDLWWLNQPDARALFAGIDPVLFEQCRDNPIDLLREVDPYVLDRLARDAGFMADMQAVVTRHQQALARPLLSSPGGAGEGPVAFFCAEFGLQTALPLYSGGLGVLAGDFLKQASDSGLPVVGVGLLYRHGYLHQRLDASGWQHEYWLEIRKGHLPIEPVLMASGEPLCVAVPIAGRDVAVRIWRVRIARVSLYLLDTHVERNPVIDRFITAQLYVGNRQLRLAQYVVLGIGGVRALRALGIAPSIVHLNEGHAALAALELAREEVARGSAFETALSAVRERVVFTTHTPVAAGNESYDEQEIRGVLGVFPAALGVPYQEVLDLGRVPDDPTQAFGLTPLALRTSRSANAVSMKHGQVARAMWRNVYPALTTDAVPIKHVTNGVHLPSWMAAPMRSLLQRHLGEGWEGHAADVGTWAAIQRIPDEEIWATRNVLRTALVEFVRTRSVEDRLARGDSLDYVEAAARCFDPNVLTVGFARRAASYKRLHLLTQDVSRALALLSSERPIQVVIAGKAHPHDEDAKRIIQEVFRIKTASAVATRVAFLEDHEMAMAARLVGGCDVWINVPRPPFEACGTSGMKAVLNGSLHLSVLDGWWTEAWDGANGWAIDSDAGQDPGVQDERDGDALYSLLEREVVPMFYTRDEASVPREWCARIKRSLLTLGPSFNAGRMLSDYLERVYAPDAGRASHASPNLPLPTATPDLHYQTMLTALSDAPRV